MTTTVRRDVYMSDSDAFSWYMEADPLLRSTVVSVMVIDGAPDMERLLERADRATRMAPGFRHKVVQAPSRLANPRWVVDPDFDLTFHVRRICAPAPGTLAEVFDYARQTGMAGFDRDRPLWEFTLVEGVEGGRVALVMKLHHALSDGIGGMEMAKYLFDLEADPGAVGPMPDAPSPETFSVLALTLDAMRHNVARVAGFARNSVGSVPAGIRSAVRNPIGALRAGGGLVGSIARTVRPVRSTLSAVMQNRRLAWHYDTIAIPLEDLRAPARDLGLTLNDAFLGAVTGGLQRYHERHGSAVDELRLTMPISIRTPDDPIGGNRVTLMRFKVPVGQHDSVTRMHHIHDSCLTARHEPAISYTNAIAGVLNVLPRGVVGGMLKHVDFLASNVPGFDMPIYLAGARVAEWYGFGPTIGAALNATLVSYNGTCYIGVNIDTGAIPDGATLMECMREGFAESTALSTTSEPTTFRRADNGKLPSDAIDPLAREMAAKEIATP
jgi:WS/DGAT/MGAT family acyltransferase